ncbi:hypothetical protein C2G38_2029073 [Gigaspora rosea]|uniref:Uncharacterized protein n=1 Tax=Gigaspora rosea TaxID=44941 RepID=A0A397W3D4_9GLOM|nr:hypothetical protein C2G38_2029073 [Gigaspora rosea]
MGLFARVFLKMTGLSQKQSGARYNETKLPALELRYIEAMMTEKCFRVRISVGDMLIFGFSVVYFYGYAGKVAKVALWPREQRIFVTYVKFLEDDTVNKALARVSRF